MTAPVLPVLRYPGGKSRLAPWIVSHLPPHDVYVEPFCGSAAVLLAKPPSALETINDLDGRVVNLFRVLRERPDDLARAVTLTPYALAEYKTSEEPTDNELEAARRFLIRVWMAHGGKLGSQSGWRRGWAGGVGDHSQSGRGSNARAWNNLPDRIALVAERLKHAMIDCRPALRVIADWRHPDTLLYCDPPYVRATTQTGHNGTKNRANERPRYYAHEMTDDEHAELLAALGEHPGPVVLSGYRTPLYDEALAGWTRVDRAAWAYRGAPRVESLWLSPVAVDRRRDLFTLTGVAL